MRHVAALEKRKQWNSSRLRATYTGVGVRLHKLRQQGIDFFFGQNGTPEGNNSIRSMLVGCNLLTQPEHMAIDVDDVDAET